MRRFILPIACAFTLVAPKAGGQIPVVKDARVISFEENKVPDNWKGAGLAINTAHYKDGKQSMQWTFKPGETISLKKDVMFQKKDPTGKDLYLSTFTGWFYNTKAINDSIRVGFYKEGKECCHFNLRTAFTGWRAAWVCFERDMQGTPQEGMDEVRFTAPKSSEGQICIDLMIPSVKTDHRHQTADRQVPFVNSANHNHWLVVYLHSQIKSDMPLTPVTEAEKADVRKLEERFKSIIFNPGKVTEKTLASIRKKFAFYQITYNEKGEISGVPIFFARAAEKFERIIPNWSKDMINKQGNELKAYFDLMNRIATAYNQTDSPEIKAEMKDKFLKMYEHATDQGIAAGSCLGNFTHYGYSFRGFYTSYFLMKDVLRQAGKLSEAEQAMLWYAITNEIYRKPTENGIDMDSFNTQTTGRIASILIMEDTPEKMRYLRSFQRWIDWGCRPANGLQGSFKVDGGAFHHCNNYPAYAVGGLDGATNMIYLLSGTQFGVSELAHKTVKNSLLAMRFYCNTLYFPLAMSGRHPDGKGRLIPLHYAQMALAGTPDGKEAIDAEMASAYLRLAAANNGEKPEEYMPASAGPRENRIRKQLEKQGFKPEADPQGNIAINYGCVSVQRRSNWSAVARGHNRYLWAAEHYLGCNLYGRYLAHGSLQIMTAPKGATVTPTTSGWQGDGFDWGRIPGTTAIHLPVDQLHAHILNVDAFSGVEEMLYSDEAFAGGLTQNHENGNFGMKLHEHDKYNGSMRARKSYHFLGGKVVCLGSDIENINSDYATETTVFQLCMKNDKDKEYWNGQNIGSTAWVDNFQTGYYIPKHMLNKLTFEKNFPQQSRHEETEKLTQGDWVSLTFNHGKAPKGESYEYAVIPQTDKNSMKAFASKPDYKVLQCNTKAHIVKDNKMGITSYVLFEKNETLPTGLLAKADTSCLVMIKEEGKMITLSVCQPDIALYRGKSDDVFDENGKRIERSIYSRPWKFNASLPIDVCVTLKGEWKASQLPANCTILSANKKQTVIKFTCKDGLTTDINLTK